MQRPFHAGWAGLITPDLAGRCLLSTGQNDTLPPDSERVYLTASTRHLWRFLVLGHHPLDTVKQRQAVVSGVCLSTPSSAERPHNNLTSAQGITAVVAQTTHPAASNLPAAPSQHFPQTNGMPEEETAGQAVSSAPQQADVSAAQEKHFQTLEQVISFFEKQDPEGFFGVPVTEAVAPNYFNVIKHPMSLLRMRQKLRALEYRTFTAFVDDFELIANNAMRYNQKRSRVHRSAVNLLRHGKKHLNTVQLEATRAIHMLHPDGPIAAAQEDAAANRAANAITLAPSASNLSKLLPSSSNLSKLLPSTSNLSKLVSTLSLPHQSFSYKPLQRGMSGLDMSVPVALQDLQAEYFSEEDPAYSSFSGTQPLGLYCMVKCSACSSLLQQHLCTSHAIHPIKMLTHVLFTVACESLSHRMHVVYMPLVPLGCHAQQGLSTCT